MDVSGDNSENQYTMEFTPKVKGTTESAVGRMDGEDGNTKVNNMQIEAPGSPNDIYEQASEESIGRKGTHEVGHTGDLKHPEDEEKRGKIRGPFYNDNLMYQSELGNGTVLYGRQLDYFSKQVQDKKSDSKK